MRDTKRLFFVIPFTPVLFERRNALLFGTRVKHAQRQRAPHRVDAVSKGSHGHQERLEAESLHGFNTSTARAPFFNLGIMRDEISAMLPPVFLLALLDLLSVMLDAGAARRIAIQDVHLRTDNLKPPDRGVVGHTKIPSTMHELIRPRLDLINAVLAAHRRHFMTVIGAE